MAQEIYHRSNWGIASNEWGSTYLNADLTNELYKRAGYYENSWATDKILNKIGTKPSIILTPTAYEDGKLNSVKPAQVIGEELVINGGFDTDSDWSLGTGWSIANGNAVATSAPSGSQLYQTSLIIGKTYQATFTITDITLGAFRFLFGDGVNTSGNYTSAGTYTVSFTAAGNNRLGIRTVGTTSGSVDNVSVKEVIDADLDFTRGSSATRVNEQGLVQDVQILGDELVQNGDFEQIGSELVTNGGFDTDSDWTKGTGWSISGGKASCDGSQTGNSSLQQSSIAEAGKVYKIVFDLTVTSGQITYVNLGGWIDNTNLNSSGTYVYTTTTTTATDNFGIAADSNFIGSIDNVSVKEVGQNWALTQATIEDGKLLLSTTDGSYTAATQTLGTIGNLYKVSLNVSNIVGTISVAIGGGTDVDITTNGTHTFEITSASTTFEVKRKFGVTNVSATIDNISLIEITDDTDLPRIDYTNGEGSLLLEPQSTNLVTYSEDFSQWTALGNTTISATNITSPSGQNNATKITGLNGSGSNDLRYQFPFNPANKTLTYSVYLKGSGTLRLQMSNGVDQAYEEEITLTSDWKRHSISKTFNSTSVSIFYLVIDDFLNKTATEYYVWGAQLEELSYATSYIPTNGTTVTRAADVANNAGNSDLINSTEGVLYYEASYIDGSDYNSISISNSSGSEKSRTWYDDTNLIFASYVNNVNQTLIAYPIFKNINYKIAIRYKLNDFALYVNGNKATNILVNLGAVSPQNSYNKLNFNSGDIYNKFYGNVKCVAVFKEALSDEELHKLTSL